ncbi:hypothetical protein EC991_005425 [Linnemannia zychae]|nr:hypothetical protein EC991_005425 [Linnemannia zychae]
MLEVCLSIPTTTSSQPQAYTGVVIAHPYGPLGGSYNNNVVGALLQWFETSSLAAPITLSTRKSKKAAGKRNSTGAGARKGSGALDQDATDSTSAKSAGAQAESLACVICAVNFRGCGKSKGKTSWFGEAEREDYQTVVDFLQSRSRTGSSASHLSTSTTNERHDSGTGSPASNRAVFDETGREIDPPRLPFLSRFILSGFSYGGMIASTIPPPLRNPADPTSDHLPTTYILISYPAGVAWFLTSGAQGGFYKRARAILQGEQQSPGDTTAATKNNSETVTETNAEVATESKKSTVEAYFITGAHDQFTSPKTLLNWLKTNAGLNPPNKLTAGSWALTRPDGAIHVDVVEDVDHFWLDREQDLVDRLQAWWSSTHSG